MKLIWADAETDGLNEFGAHRILELVFFEAELETPHDIKPVPLWRGVFPLEPEDLRTLDPHILKVHGSNGLLNECLESELTLWEAEEALLKLIPVSFKQDGMPRLAGSSVSYDHNMIKYWMPRLGARFSHNYYDVSTKKLICRSLGMPKIEKGHAHRAQPDILESIEHSKACDAWLANYYRGYQQRQMGMDAQLLPLGRHQGND